MIFLCANWQERERYKEPVRESLKALLALNWTVEHAEVDVPPSHRGSTRRQSKPNVVSILIPCHFNNTNKNLCMTFL